MNYQVPPSNNVQHLPPAQVAFHRTELAIILSLYGRMVAAGEWRDYGISLLRDVAVFSVFRRTAENPLYRIYNHPRLRARQGMYCVFGMDGRVLKRGGDLGRVPVFGLDGGREGARGAERAHARIIASPRAG